MSDFSVYHPSMPVLSWRNIIVPIHNSEEVDIQGIIAPYSFLIYFTDIPNNELFAKVNGGIGSLGSRDSLCIRMQVTCALHELHVTLGHHGNVRGAIEIYRCAQSTTMFHLLRDKSVKIQLRTGDLIPHITLDKANIYLSSCTSFSKRPESILYRTTMNTDGSSSYNLGEYVLENYTSEMFIDDSRISIGQLTMPPIDPKVSYTGLTFAKTDNSSNNVTPRCYDGSRYVVDYIQLKIECDRNCSLKNLEFRDSYMRRLSDELAKHIRSIKYYAREHPSDYHSLLKLIVESNISRQGTLSSIVQYAGFDLSKTTVAYLSIIFRIGYLFSIFRLIIQSMPNAYVLTPKLRMEIKSPYALRLLNHSINLAWSMKHRADRSNKVQVTGVTINPRYRKVCRGFMPTQMGDCIKIDGGVTLFDSSGDCCPSINLNERYKITPTALAIGAGSYLLHKGSQLTGAILPEPIEEYVEQHSEDIQKHLKQVRKNPESLVYGVLPDPIAEVAQ